MKYSWVIILFLFVFASGLSYAIDPSKDEGLPDSHRAGWETKHQTAAKAYSSSCTGCHKAYFCINCHNRRDTIQQVVHRRNFKFYHSVEARANPRKCDECHRPQYCADCHANPR